MVHTRGTKREKGSREKFKSESRENQKNRDQEKEHLRNSQARARQSGRPRTQNTKQWHAETGHAEHAKHESARLVQTTSCTRARRITTGDKNWRRSVTARKRLYLSLASEDEARS